MPFIEKSINKKILQTTDNEEGYDDKPISPKKIKQIKGFNVDSKTRERFILWLKQRAMEPNPPTQLKRIMYKDGGFRESVVRGFLDLINEFMESREQ
jgi:hypothetical protein